MLHAVCIILLCQLVGEVIIRAAALPIPGPVLGMGLMLAILYLSPSLRAKIQPVANTILSQLLLLFVPAGVGAALQVQVLGWTFAPMILAIAVSTILAIIFSALTFHWVSTWIEGKTQ